MQLMKQYEQSSGQLINAPIVVSFLGKNISDVRWLHHELLEWQGYLSSILEFPCILGELRISITTTTLTKSVEQWMGGRPNFFLLGAV